MLFRNITTIGFALTFTTLVDLFSSELRRQLLIVDSSDPVGPAETLFSTECAPRAAPLHCRVLPNRERRKNRPALLHVEAYFPANWCQTMGYALNPVRALAGAVVQVLRRHQARPHERRRRGDAGRVLLAAQRAHRRAHLPRQVRGHDSSREVSQTRQAYEEHGGNWREEAPSKPRHIFFSGSRWD